MINFRTWIFEKFPYYFWENDTYKDGEGHGLFQRYLETVGIELDSELVNKIPGLLDLTNAELVASKQLIHLAEVLGNPPDTFGDETKYRKLLKYITNINKEKGNLKGYQLIFGVLGVDVEIEEVYGLDNHYDTELQYDTDLHYDGNCPPCSNYTLAITDPDGNCPEIADAPTNPIINNLLMAIIKYVEPINAVLVDITYGGGSLTDQWVLTTGIWNDNNYWNDVKIYRDEP